MVLCEANCKRSAKATPRGGGGARRPDQGYGHRSIDADRWPCRVRAARVMTTAPARALPRCAEAPAAGVVTGVDTGVDTVVNAGSLLQRFELQMELQLYRSPTFEQPDAEMLVQPRLTTCAEAVLVMQYVALHTTVGV